MSIIAAEPALNERDFDDLLGEAVGFHGDMSPGQVLGVRMAVAGCPEVGLDPPRSAGKGLVVFVEIDRCATDAIQALTGVSLGKRTLKHLDYGKAAATFVNVGTGRAVRVAARDSAREAAGRRMKAGEQCGACHTGKTMAEGKTPFALADTANCERCHKK